MTEEKSEKKLTFLKKLNEIPPDTSKSVAGAVCLDNPNKTHGHPAVAGHMGIEIITNDCKIEVREPQTQDFEKADYIFFFAWRYAQMIHSRHSLNQFDNQSIIPLPMLKVF